MKLGRKGNDGEPATPLSGGLPTITEESRDQRTLKVGGRGHDGDRAGPLSGLPTITDEQLDAGSTGHSRAGPAEPSKGKETATGSAPPATGYKPVDASLVDPRTETTVALNRLNQASEIAGNALTQVRVLESHVHNLTTEAKSLTEQMKNCTEQLEQSTARMAEALNVLRATAGALRKELGPLQRELDQRMERGGPSA